MTATAITAAAVDDLAAEATTGRTPRRIFREHVARERIETIARVRDALGRPPLELVAGYSFKTNPRPELLEIARKHGFFAETISRDELEWAEHERFAPEQTIYNGPEPLLDRREGERLAYAFADSVEAFERNVQRGVAHVHGVRLRPSMIASRFGVPVDDDAALIAAVRATPAGTPLGVSFHARREDFKGASWRDVAGDVLDRAIALEHATGRRIVAFDVGGGWTPEDFDAHFEPDMRWMVDRIVPALPACTRLMFEPGQSLCTPTEALLAEVLEVRVRGPRRDAVVDIGYNDWPEMNAYAHGLFLWRGGRWEPVGRGPDRLLGRTCLEYDVVEGIRYPEDLAPGDRLLIADTGSYDHAMAFNFARGAGKKRTLSD
jgi:diaminopimelate decarboxylase